MSHPQALFVQCAHGNGDAQAAGEARGHLDCTHRIGVGARTPVLSAAERVAGFRGFRRVCREAVCEVLCGEVRAAVDSERGIAWRLADSLALRRFVGIGLDEYTPDHSTISRTRRLIDVDTHGEVFRWVLSLLADRGLLQGKRVAIDATTLEANAAMRSIVRRDTGESYEEFLRGLAKAAGITTPTREELARLDRKRQKRMSNQEWKSPADEDARIAKMKDGRTHLAHKAEHAVDLDTGAVVAVTLQGADQGDTTTLDETLCEAGMAVAEQIGREAELRPDDKPKVNVNGI